jgi:hypothetical protein
MWYSRAGCVVLGLYGLYWTWALSKDPSACRMASFLSRLVVCGISNALGNLAASIFVFLTALGFFFYAFRPHRRN